MLVRAEIVGNIHIHTRLSDGTGDSEDVSIAASRAGLDFILIADHNLLTRDREGRYGDVLVLVGQEVHHGEWNHLLIFGAPSDLSHLGGDPQTLVDAARAQGALTFIAHPCERPASAPYMAPIPWVDWWVEGYTGLEIWNYMSEVKGRLSSKVMAFLTAYLPDLVLSGPFPETLRRWDRLCSERAVPAIGSSDAHAEWYSLGPLRRQVFSYEHLLRRVNTHVLLERPLAADVAQAAQAIYRGLAAGHCFVANVRLGAARGFSFHAERAGAKVALMGDTVNWSRDLLLRAVLPGRGRLRLLRDGEPLLETDLGRLCYHPTRSGVYRVEALRRFARRWRGWIYSNPIYLR